MRGKVVTPDYAVCDVLGFGETMLRFSPPAGGRLEDARTFESYVAGTESNTLAGASRLGLRCAWISALPENALGRRVAGELQRYGVDTRGVVWAHGPSRLGVFYAEESPAPAGPQVQYDRAGSAIALLDSDAVDLSILETARVLHLTGITPALGSGAREVFQRLVQKARDAGVEISFDVNYRAQLWEAPEATAGIEEVCRAASLLICTRDDAATLWGFTGSAESVLRQVEERFGAGKTIVMTLGSEGAAELLGGKYDEAPAFPSEGKVRFGSGDAFAAGYLCAYLEGPGYKQVREVESAATPLLFGNAVAALKRCIAGDIATITPKEVLGVLQKDEIRFR
ncbi:MAG TPA: sugar kinase [Rubrobacteraceae bacterium]|nr:sugar kinase [Rubrobacteraceae bacterium]